jgi:hypothetical protein
MLPITIQIDEYYDSLIADEEEPSEVDPDLLYERFLENGGAYADRIQAEDEIELSMEAEDLGLQELRAGR